MKKTPIFFHTEGVIYIVENQEVIKEWITEVIKKEGYELITLNIILCNEKKLIKINKKYLKQDSHTDIISFDNSDKKQKIEGDLFVSINRVKDNAKKYCVENDEELKRVIIHGILHLMGYKDKTKKGKALIKRKENKYLSCYYG